MKLSKKTLFVLAAVVFIVVLVGVGRAYLQQVSEQKKVNEQLALAQTRLKGIQEEPSSSNSSKRTELEERLSQATSKLEAAKATLHQSLDGESEDLAVSRTLFDLAKDYSVEITEMTFPGTANETLGGVAWSVTSLTVKLKGDSPNLIGLVTKLNSRFATGAIKSVTITMEAPVVAPDFQLQNLNGQNITLSEFRGKPVLINFWATWCPYCVDEMPYIQQIYNEWSGKGLVVLAINANESPALVKGFLQTYKLSLPVLLDTGNKVGGEKYGVSVIPTTFFIDRDGIIQDMFGAFPSKEAIEQHLGKIIPYSGTPTGQKASAEIQLAIYTYQGG